MYFIQSKMAATFESVLVLRLRDVQELSKTYLDAWKSGKVCCPHKDCYRKMFFCVLMD